MSPWNLLVLFLNSVIHVTHVTSLLPQVSQEGLLRPYRSYADVTLFHYFVPNEVSRATFEFAAFMDSPNCPARNVYVVIQQGSYPVMSPDNATFPEKLFTGRTSMFTIVLRSSYQPHDATVFPVYNPLPGSWFAAAYLPDYDQQVQQEGIGHRCQYSLGSVALWSQVANIEAISIKTTTRPKCVEHFTYFKFYIPAGTWEFSLKINGCKFHSVHRFPETESASGSESTIPCIKNVFLRPRALPRFRSDGKPTAISDLSTSEFSHVEKLPFTDSYYYLLVVAEAKVSFNISIFTKDCPLQILGRSFIQQFAGVHTAANLKDQAVRLNMSTTVSTKLVSGEGAGSGGEDDDTLNFTCDCVPMFRLTRIKHAQDFSDTFLLEGREWFTTWMAVTDLKQAGVMFEILPYVDIGGTLSIRMHLDALLLNSTTQILHVFACVRKSRPPEALCCSSAPSGNISSCCEAGLGLHVSSENVSVIEDNILIPYPEPDVWFISFTTVCKLGDEIVPCIVEEALLSLDIRTQPCVRTQSSSPGSSAILPCGSFGVCQEVHKGQFFYTSCRCIGGYRGWACNDDSQATPEAVLLSATLLLTLSNLFFIPAIFLALRRRMFPQVLIYSVTMISSAMYHACDQDIYSYCLTRYSVLQFCDFFCSILAFWVTLIALAKTPKHDSSLYLVGAVMIAILVEYNRTGLMVFVLPFGLGVAIPVAVWTYRSVRRRTLILPKLSVVLFFLPGVILGAAGLILFAFVETEDNYRYTHSAWHVIIALSLLYLLPKTKKSPEDLHGAESDGNGSTAAAELSAVNGDTQHQSASPVFFITSDLDHLVQEQSR